LLYVAKLQFGCEEYRSLARDFKVMQTGFLELSAHPGREELLVRKSACFQPGVGEFGDKALLWADMLCQEGPNTSPRARELVQFITDLGHPTLSLIFKMRVVLHALWGFPAQTKGI
jgi:hypothetical protein